MKTQIIVTVDKVLNDASRRILPSQITRELGDRLLNVIDVQFKDEPFEQFLPTPTEAEINEAAEAYRKTTVASFADVTFKAGIQWLQNYQTQGREKPEQTTYTESEVKLIATRFARESRIRQDITSNDTIQSFDNWFKPEDFNKTYQTHGMEKAVTVEPKYRVGRKLGTVILTVNGETEVARVYDKQLAQKVCDSLNETFQPNPAIAVIEAEKKRITEAMKVRSTNFDNIELNLLNRLLSKYNEQSI